MNDEVMDATREPRVDMAIERLIDFWGWTNAPRDYTLVYDDTEMISKPGVRYYIKRLASDLGVDLESEVEDG